MPNIYQINNKTRKYNDIIEWLRKMNVGFTLVNIDTFGIGLVNSMTDGLWYIERNHDTLADMASPVLAPLKHSKTYYCPEKRKRKKVDFSVLNEDTLRNHSTTIMTLFFFQREQWAAVKQVCHTIPYLLNFWCYKYKILCFSSGSKLYIYLFMYKCIRYIDYLFWNGI